MEDKFSTYLIDKKKDIKLLEVKRRSIRLNPTKDFILSIIGPRRAGKTYLLYHFIKSNNLEDEDYLFVNFEEIDGSLSDFIDKHQEIYGKYPIFLFLDEIQNLKNWEREVYRTYERKRFCIFLTGSSSKFLSKEIATQLRGRSLTIKVFPFSFKEILEVHNLTKRFLSSEEIGKIKNLLRIHIKRGCFPDVVLKKVEASRFISELIDLVIYRDIMERYGIKNRVGLEFFIKSAIASNSNLFSINKTYNVAKSLGMKISKNTLYSFQRFLEDVGMFFFLKKYSRSLRKIELSLPKCYVVDNGLYTFTTYKHDVGVLMESFVFQELVKAGYEPNRDIFYLGNNEVDFVLVERGMVKQLIQVTFASEKDELKRREITSLVKVSKKLNCEKLLLITWDYEDRLEIGGKIVNCLPLWKWILKLEIFKSKSNFPKIE